MTLDEFLDDYVPRVLKPMGGWSVRSDGGIRRGACCPLTAESNRASAMYLEDANRLGIDRETRRQIVDAADAWPDDRLTSIRARLLAGLGLSDAR